MDESPPPPPDDEHELELQIREHRKFSLAEAIGRLGGGDLMKGASPVTVRRQAELIVEDYLEKHLRDAEGALEVVLLRQVAASSILLESGYEEPLIGLGKFCQRLLDSPSRLSDLVREVDAQWGRLYQERPYFQRPGQPPHADDPYTVESVSRQMTQLLTTLIGEA
ncbi:MAG: hypothetical protein KDA44_11900 [Planctomycetales bacterium]|nr:hypothetical protein [Planctomycetales bacterium]